MKDNDMSPIIEQIEPELAGLLPRFRELVEQDADKIRESLIEGDFARLKRLGHNLKGAGASYGFDGLAEIGGDIELASDSFDALEVNSCLERLEYYLANVQLELKDS